MPNKPRLLWIGPQHLNGRAGWAAVEGGHSFLIAQEENGSGFTASAMRMANVDHRFPRNFRPDPDRPGGMLAEVKSADELPLGSRQRPVMLGGGDDGALFSTIEEAKAACETYARGVRRGLNS